MSPPGKFLFAKRCLDLAASGIALAALAPLILAIAASVLLFMGRPVFFTQVRPGLKGRPFRLRKFRTMTNARDAGGQPLPDAARLTRFGEFLRRTSLDELPELWNVLVGDMSLVGPRPLLMEYLPLYTPEQMRRHQMRPGLTGWAQVNGRNGLTWEEKFKLDVWYVDHASMALDLKILALTVAKVISAEGISQEGHATMEKFTGRAPSVTACGSGDRGSPAGRSRT